MWRWLAFWTGAVVVAAAVAFAVTGPEVLESLTPREEPVPDRVEETPAAPEESVAPEPVVDSGLSAPPQPAPEPPEPVDVPDPPELSRLVTEAEAPRGPPPAELGDLAIGELPFGVDCGLILRPMGERAVVFASGVSLDPAAGGPAAVQVDGETVLLDRVRAEGDPLGYSQFSRQLYRNDEETVTVAVEIELEDELFGESARVSAGELTLMKAERATTRMEVAGRAGC